MKTKYIVLIALILILSSGAFFLYKKKKGLEKVKVKSVSLKPELNLKSTAGVFSLLANLAALSVPATANLELTNFSTQSYSIDNVQANIYTPDGILIASAINPKLNAVKLSANTNTRLSFKYNLNLPGILKTVKNIPGTTVQEKVKYVLLNYIQNGVFGIQIRMKGFLNYKGISVDFNELIDI